MERKNDGGWGKNDSVDAVSLRDYRSIPSIKTGLFPIDTFC